MAKETAEQRLLKMMNKTATVPSSAAMKAPARKKLSFTFSMRTVNQLLFLGIVACIGTLVYEMRSGMELLSKDVNVSDDLKSPSPLSQIALPTNKDIKYYLDKVNTRNIFRPYEAQAKASAGQLSLAKRLAKYKLVGVAWLDLPETATIMVEDPENKATYFLRAGEQLEGVTVKTIYTDRAVFSSENEETTIKL